MDTDEANANAAILLNEEEPETPKQIYKPSYVTMSSQSWCACSNKTLWSEAKPSIPRLIIVKTSKSPSNKSKQGSRGRSEKQSSSNKNNVVDDKKSKSLL